MDLTIEPTLLHGTVPAIASKSAAHRMLLAAALSHRPTTLEHLDLSNDILATMQCLKAMGATVCHNQTTARILPGRFTKKCRLPCGESGTTLRFLLPVVSALGIQGDFIMEGRLPQRPLGPLDQELERHGITFFRPSADCLQIRGVLSPGEYVLPGNVSSQFISGLLFALPLLSEESTLTITEPLQSAPYVEMTLEILNQFGIHIPFKDGTFQIKPGIYAGNASLSVEGDWSNAAFWLTAAHLGSDLTVTNLQWNSAQGDKAIVSLLPKLGKGSVIDAAQIPDLIPILAVAAANARSETHFIHAQRLRMKESDRIESVCHLINGLGGCAIAAQDSLTIHGSGLRGGVVRTFGDHRIAMAGAIAATVCKESVIILDAQVVKKSYPNFWRDYRNLGGTIKEHTHE